MPIYTLAQEESLVSLSVLQVLALILLTSPAGIFSNFEREIGARPTATEPEI